MTEVSTAEPTCHLRPASGWLNDPNGLCRIDGEWHVFFQHQPDEPVHRDICWGHASSHDLLRWRHHPVALRPTPGGIDGAGCWSGCVVWDGGVPTAVYSAVRTGAASAVAAIARGDASLDQFVAQPDPVAPPSLPPGLTEARDPFVFEFGGRRYAVQGAGTPGGRAAVLVHTCDQLTRWSAPSVLLDLCQPRAASVAAAQIWECPSLVPVGDRWLLVVSTVRDADTSEPELGVAWMLGELALHEGMPRFEPTCGGPFDVGDAWYAPQLLVADDRILAWGWLRETARSQEQVRDSGWSGLLSLPREVVVTGDRVVMVPASELTGLRAHPLSIEPGEPFAAAAFEVVCTGPATLQADGTQGVSVWGSPQQPARILVDGDTVEAFDTNGSTSTRLVAPATWCVRADLGTVRAHSLAIPAG